ncbi:UNVERIFIED_ORG: cell division protein FtsZ [Rhizobium etli]|uniref:Cell division protein FtsZ n=1 Tax=Rhizobium etli bv. mimosae str. IE4771 TaxID=1432050 RepID=A0A060I3A6_RHIET|nr:MULTISPECIES: cell division protein FtsZ [Rhizobium]AJC80244.1 cell division protein FtsZ 2 [Rhizobium etli bv. phaseoli str. IE4803]UWU33149.1 cell division protein FtsZ [Rhizobium leguminosarum bv. phaseoli]AIC28194.1 cell division protein FtsZ 2 [Rhizobium sp. IE4771]ARQ59089.1 cell division protein FtsZ 2 [Rhizobium sp. Kim5]RSC01565.1 cell division protein FtsZ [Rhizobium sophoriradicis]
MTIKLQKPDITELKPRITVFGVGGGGGNAVNNMITAGLQGVDFVVANTDAQALTMTKAERIIQLGVNVTEGLGAGSQPEVGRAAAEECIDEIVDHLNGTHMCFVTAGMGGGTGTGAAPVVAQAARNKGILTVGVVTKPFHFEGGRRMRLAEMGIQELQKSVDTLIVIPNQNLFRIANDKTTFADAFAMADQVLYSGVACITDLMVKEGLINLDFADVRSVMREMGRAMMGTGEASGAGRALQAAEAAIANPLLDETSMKGAQGLLISITGGRDLTLFEVDEAATRIREEVDPDANIILGATFDESLEGIIRVSVVATGIDRAISEAAERNFQPAAKPAIRPSAAVAPAAAAVQPAPVMQAPKAIDPIAQTIREAEMERELEIPAPRAAAPLQQPAAQQEVFRPQSKIFAPAPEAPAMRPQVPQQAPAPVMSQPVMSQPIQQQPIQPQPVRQEPVIRQAPEPMRMPKVEDFPPVVQAELDHRTQAASAHGQEERGPMGLLKRITNSLGRRDDDAVAADMTAAPPAASQQRRPLSPEASLYAPRRGNLDDQGRAVPQARMMQEDDQLEIPAFLRRQSN